MCEVSAVAVQALHRMLCLPVPRDAEVIAVDVNRVGQFQTVARGSDSRTTARGVTPK